jgi:hypothetical protein
MNHQRRAAEGPQRLQPAHPPALATGQDRDHQGVAHQRASAFMLSVMARRVQAFQPKTPAMAAGGRLDAATVTGVSAAM